MSFTVTEDPFNEAANVLGERRIREHLYVCGGAFHDRVPFEHV